MAKKSTKNSRRSRAKKEQTSKKKITTKKQVTVQTSQEAEGTKPKKTVSSKKPIEAAVEAEVERELTDDDTLAPARNRMLVSAIALGVVVVVLIIGATFVRQQKTEQANGAKSGQVSGKADEILQSGGNVCTNGNSPSSTTGSSNPGTVGMILQTNPASDIQTPETMGGGNDLNTLQGAACY